MDGDLEALGLAQADARVLAQSLAAATDLASALAAIDRARVALLGPGLLTVNAVRAAAEPGCFELTRLWSSDPHAYPVGGTKRKTPASWTTTLLVEGRVFVGEGPDALAQVFDDHARIAALGLLAIVNLPFLAAGRVWGTFNLLGRRPRWEAHEVELACRLAALAAPHVAAAQARLAG